MIILLVEKVDINRIKALLESVPGKMEISAINLTNGYSLSLTAGEQEINQAEFEKALNELNQILKKYKEIDDNIKLLKWYLKLLCNNFDWLNTVKCL